MKEQTRECKYCGSETTVKVGIHNWKNLLRKPTLDEWIMLFIIVLSVFSYYQYKTDIKNIVEFYEGGDYCSNQLQLNNQENKLNPSPYQLNLSNLDSLDESNGG